MTLVNKRVTVAKLIILQSNEEGREARAWHFFVHFLGFALYFSLERSFEEPRPDALRFGSNKLLKKPKLA